jgi:CheY-like chemotaxis protein
MPNEKILLVDDEEHNLKLLTRWLMPMGYMTEFALNGEEAVQMAGDGRHQSEIRYLTQLFANVYQKALKTIFYAPPKI